MVNKKRTRVSAAEMPPPPATTPSPIPRRRGPEEREETKEKGSYEKLREERIKENLERIQNLGIMELSHNVDSSFANASANASPLKRRRSAKPAPIAAAASPDKLRPPPPPRRSSRLQNASPVSYAEIRVEKNEKSARSGLALVVAQGEREEVYTDEHAALLGSCEATWTLFVDGYDNHGKRIYDQIKGKTCHQCRQKTLGHHTHCSRCNLVQGQFCGDCLYMRYGENVLEAEKNVNWICPVCRGICNCSLCRTKKGWAPTGALYKKVSNLGFKSVAHYLIQTQRSQTNSEDQISGQLASASEEFAPFSNVESTLGLDTLDLEKGLNSEIADKNNNNDSQTKMISFAGSELRQVSPHPQESLMVYSGLNMGPSEEGTNDFNYESRPECADEHTPSDISRGSIAKPVDKSEIAKEPGAVEKLRSDSIAGRLRNRVRIPTA